MSKKGKTSVNIGGGASLFLLLIVLSFCGDPDLHDSLLKYTDSLSVCKGDEE